NSFGKYIDGEQIEQRRPQYLSEMLRSVSGVNVSASPRGIGNMVRIRGCAPLVWLDGVRMPGPQLRDPLQQPSTLPPVPAYPLVRGDSGAVLRSKRNMRNDPGLVSLAMIPDDHRAGNEKGLATIARPFDFHIKTPLLTGRRARRFVPPHRGVVGVTAHTSRGG